MHAGFDPLTERDLFVVEATSPATLPANLGLPSPRFVCLVVWDATGCPGATLGQLANWLLDAGAVYVCCWGSDCERVHDAIDEADVQRNPSCDPVVMTTWHFDEPLEEVVYFALNTTWPDPAYAKGCTSTLAVCIGNRDWPTPFGRRSPIREGSVTVSSVTLPDSARAAIAKYLSHFSGPRCRDDWTLAREGTASNVSLCGQRGTEERCPYFA